MDTFFVPDGYRARATQSGLLLARRNVHVRCIARQRPLVHPHVVLAGLDLTARAAARPVTWLMTEERELALRTGDVLPDHVRELAMIVGDDSAAVIVGAAPHEMATELEQIVDELCVQTRLQLGVRRRRYLYAPPAGWQRFSLDGMDAHFLAPGHPRTPGCLTVHAADPDRDLVSNLWTEDAARFVPSIEIDPLPLRDEEIEVGALSGRRVRLAGRDHGRELLVDLACLTDETYAYPIVAVGDAGTSGARMAAVDALLASIRPLAPRVATLERLAPLLHWCQ